MATPQERRKELRRNPTNYLARANMGKYRAYLRERLAKKNIDPKKIDIKQEGNKFVFVSPNNNKKITKKNIAPPVDKKDSLDPRFKANIDEEISKIEKGTYTVRKLSNPPKDEVRPIEEKRLTRKQLREMSPAERKAYNERQKETPPASTPTVGGAKGRKDRRGGRKEGTGKVADALKYASLLPIGGVLTYAGVRFAIKGGKIFAKTKLGEKVIDKTSALGKKVMNAFRKKKAESPRDASAMRQSSPKTKRRMDKSLFKKRKQKQQEKKTESKAEFKTDSKGRTEDVRDTPRKTTGVTDKPPAGAKNTTMNKTTKPKANKDKTFTKRANKDRDKQNERSKQDMGYDQATNPKKYLDALIVARAKELGMTYRQLRYQINRIFIRNKHQKIKTGGVKQKLNDVTSEQLKKNSPFMRDVKAFVDKMRTNKKYAKQTQGRTEAKINMNKKKPVQQELNLETKKVSSPLKRFQKLTKKFRLRVFKDKLPKDARTEATKSLSKVQKVLRNPRATEKQKAEAVEGYAQELGAILQWHGKL